ncbi:peptidoglycan-binding domain-containing protein [Antrihabitans cavernicola]|uniref:Peptidoglycan-binding protein n=1 Tax=Antrihabitans cavernicola TaxID=2495913 RepID=A0A5A7S0Z7_9NOCA|nr:hypothetical protein [Spelaeibacter cavernicola]KAA0016752.1 hypothetical protein FOY51_25740 [Spelaeibacter cavernicola]
MAVLRQNVENTKAYLRARNGLPYGYGGTFSNTNLSASTDCSGLAFGVVAGCVGKPMNTRYGSTEALRVGSWEYGNAGVNSLGLVHAGSNRSAVPANAAVKVGLMHGGGGEDSHVACTVDGLNAESRGMPGGVIIGSVNRGGTTYWARAWDDSLFHDFWYLPGPIVGEIDPNVFPLPDGFYYGWYSGPEQSVSGRAGEPVPWLDGLARAQEKLGVPVTRVYDAATNKAAMDFQRAKGFALVDGFIGAKTWPLLVGGGAVDTGDLSVADANSIITFIKAYVGPIGSDVKDIRQQLTGGRDAGDYRGFPQLGHNADGSNKTVVDSIADLRDRVIALEGK